jgi:diadenosine tetraphosphate (Ap4A) HIT family hydrolase
MLDCPFCLENDQLVGRIIARDQHCYMVEFRGPVLADAVMIIPMRHVATPFELTDDEWRSTHALMRQAKEFLDKQQPQGYSVGWNVHEVGGQSIPHAHLHVIGRFADEPLAGQGIRHALKQESNRRRASG